MSKDWPIYFKDKLIISNLESNTAIATLWTPKEAVHRLVPEDQYALMGQLYTKKGINYLLRNILANPFITKLYIVGNDLMESGVAIKLFFEKGVTDDYKVIGDDSAEIESEISIDALNRIRANVELVDLIGVANLPKLKESIKSDKAQGQWAEPEVFPDPPKPQISTYPSELDLMKIRRPTIADGYLAVLKHINMFGIDSEPSIANASDSSKKMKELLNLSVVITEEDPTKWNLPEFLPFGKEDLENYFKGFFDHERHTEDYTYGERLYNYAKEEIGELKEIYPWLKIDRFRNNFEHGGIDQVSISIVRKLKSFKYDKGAIALLGNTFTDVFPQRPPKKIPCLFLIQCQIYQDKLNLTAYFRSNDMYSAWPLNAFALRKLQMHIADELKVDLGPLITISNMAHIYEHNYPEVEKILKNEYKGFCEWDPRGNIIVEVIGDEIVARLISPEGNTELNEWRIDGTEQHAARKISFEIENSLAISTLGNAIYIGRQLERAETAIKLGLEFKQDNPLDLGKFMIE